jgi:DNA-binding IclR family transcriptional regulator
MASGTRATPDAVYSQTLDRGLHALRVLAESDYGMSVQELADALGVHRSIAYRILRTLEQHGLAERDPHNRYLPGVGLAALARAVRRSLQTAALPEMSDIADDVAMTTFLVVRDESEAVTIASVEPRHSHVHVTYRPGIRHAIECGAPGLALLAAEPAREGERPEVRLARDRGWAASFQEVLPGMRSIAVPIRAPAQVLASLAVVYVDATTDAPAVADRLQRGARAIAAELG